MGLEAIDPVKEYEYLEHYGRLGMKWYKHIYGEKDGRAKYLNKGFKKAEKMYNKAEKALAKTNKFSSKAIDAGTKAQKLTVEAREKKLKLTRNLTTRKANKYKAKFVKYQKKYEKFADKWYKKNKKGIDFTTKMESIFGEIRMSELNTKQQTIGKAFCMNLLNDDGYRRKSN